MNKLLVKCIETLYIYFLNDVIAINFYPWSPFHITNFNRLHGYFLSITCLRILISFLNNIYD
jgi:hypothetical protein